MTTLKFGFVAFQDARTFAELAHVAEDAGWDGLFMGEALWHHDPWICMAAAAMRTSRIRLGTMIAPVPSMIPRKLAAESVTLDNLSNGRVILGMGVGATWMGYQAFPDEETGLKERTARLDEMLDVLEILYSRQQEDYTGAYYRLKLSAMDRQYYAPPPAQQPRPLLWVVGMWPRMKSMRRSLRCDGVIVEKKAPDGQSAQVTAQDVREIKAYVEANRDPASSFDIVVGGQTFGMSAAQKADLLRPHAEAGTTWWIESPSMDMPANELKAILRQGPPRLG